MAVLMPLRLEYASLAFGLLWSAGLVALGLRLKKLGMKQEETGQTARKPVAPK